ncbi:Early nodulin-like protein 1 [Bienertia sinuspersici]
MLYLCSPRCFVLLYSTNSNCIASQSLLLSTQMFLYPPSQDSVIQVTPQAYKSCNIKDPILSMNNGNSLFNITKPGEYYFTSGEEGHCEKGQKLQISIDGDGAIVYAPSEGPGAMSETADSPSYQQAFGSIPTNSTSSPINRFSMFLTSFVGLGIWVLV